MKRSLAALAILLASSALALAQTAPLPTKASPGPAGYPTGSGLYGGIGTFAEEASSSISNGGTSTSLYSVGGALEAVVGYQYRLPGNNFGFTEFGANYTNLGGTTACAAAGGITGCSIAGAWGFTIGTAIGFPWTAPFTWFPSFAGLFGGVSPLSLLPTGLIPVSSLPYLGAWADINQMSASVTGVGGSSMWQATPAIGIGLLNYIPNGGVFDTRVKYEFASTSFAIGPAAAAQKGGTLILEGIYKF